MHIATYCRLVYGTILGAEICNREGGECTYVFASFPKITVMLVYTLAVLLNDGKLKVIE